MNPPISPIHWACIVVTPPPPWSSLAPMGEDRNLVAAGFEPTTPCYRGGQGPNPPDLSSAPTGSLPLDRQPPSSYRYCGFNSDGLAWLLICTSLILQQLFVISYQRPRRGHLPIARQILLIVTLFSPRRYVVVSLVGGQIVIHACDSFSLSRLGSHFRYQPLD